jgi:transcriptional regulator with XRE-family HTH domain
MSAEKERHSMLARRSDATDRADVNDRADDAAQARPDTLGGRIAHAREAQGLSLAQAARRLGVKSTTLRSWELDHSEPRANRLAMLAGFLGVSPSWILTGVGRGPLNISASDEIDSIRSEVFRLKDEMSGLQDRMEALAMRLRDVRSPESGAS